MVGGLGRRPAHRPAHGRGLRGVPGDLLGPDHRRRRRDHPGRGRASGSRGSRPSGSRLRSSRSSYLPAGAGHPRRRPSPRWWGSPSRWRRRPSARCSCWASGGAGSPTSGAIAGLLVGGLLTGGAVARQPAHRPAGGWFAALSTSPPPGRCRSRSRRWSWVSRLTRHRIPAHAARFMVRLHTPETVPLDRAEARAGPAATARRTPSTAGRLPGPPPSDVRRRAGGRPARAPCHGDGDHTLPARRTTREQPER